VYIDLHSTFQSMAHDFDVDIVDAGNYVPKADAKICRIKELCRTVKRGLAWILLGSVL
jgi:hypothetical protein